MKILRCQDQWGIRLEEYCKPGTRYAALSYCWGGEQEVQTRTQTLQKHRRDIKFSSLLLKLQHAIEVTNELGLDYLWYFSLSAFSFVC